MDAADLDLPTLVSLAAPAVVRLVLDRLAERGYPGVKPSHGYVIQRLVDGQPTIGELADALGMTQQGASKQVADLERLGYAERVPDARDQRVRTVRLTAAGEGVLTEARRARAELEAEITRLVGDDEVATTKTVLGALLRVTGVAEHVPNRSVPLPDA